MSKTLPPDAIAALHVGNKIEAIKIVRESGVPGLKEAKDRVDEYLLEHPELQERFARGGLKQALSWLFTIAVALAAIAYFWPRS